MNKVYLIVVVGLIVAHPAGGIEDGLVCRMPSLSSPAVELFPSDQSVADFIRENMDTLAFLDSVLESEGEVVSGKKKGGPVRYSINESVSAAVSYDHTFMFETATNEELRTHRFGAFSTDRERDVLGLGMDWSLGDSVVGLGYQLESSRPGADPARPPSIIPRSDDVEHAFTLGVSRSWGRDD